MSSEEAPTVKPTARRDHLISIEGKIREKWAAAKLFEHDAPTDAASLAEKKKFMVTFPYPYMNGALHLGHAFSVSKAEFAVRFQRLMGKHTLFPFGFHCTGMPILACAQKLQKEVAKFGNPPVFPVPVVEPEEEEEPEEAEAKDATATTAAAVPVEKKRKKKGKLAAKTGKETYQWNIMRDMGVPVEDIAKFQDPAFWLQYWPPIAQNDLNNFGLAVDWRRSFITTDVNPYYDAFIRWQFNHLRAKGKVSYGKLMCICTPSNMQVCADHDRKDGEGVVPQAYTLIKLKMLAPYPQELVDVLATHGLTPEGADAVNVYLPAATLRPETMYGQTNAFVLPTGQYNVYRISKDEVFITTDRAAANMAGQEIFQDLPEGAERRLGDVSGKSLLGCAIKAPLAKYEKVYILPLLSILMDKGTGIVTSVPSDAPADYAALQDMKNKPDMRTKFGISDDMVLPYEVVPIIKIEDLDNTDQAAVMLCKKYGVKSQNDLVLLNKIKDEVYKYGFDRGVLLVGEFAGKLVKDVKDQVKNWMIEQNMALAYSEPESRVVSRTDEECVAAYLNQWFLTYGEETWRENLRQHVIGENFNCYNKNIQGKVLATISWLRQWGCSRAFGLGTKLPFDDKFLVESLSDSTIYMAYYTIANFLQGGVLDGSVAGAAAIQPEQLTDKLFDYVFLDAPYTEDIGVSEATLQKMRREFEFWYPMDLRVSGKDLLNNHLIMSLYNHDAMWDSRADRMPQGFFANGLLMIDGQKMSKSTGNFLTLAQSLDKFGADATRLALATSGDSLDDANFSSSVTDGCILRLTREEDFIRDECLGNASLRTGELDFWDKVALSQIATAVENAKKAYDGMVMMDAMKFAFYELLNIRDEYRLACDTVPLHADVLRVWTKCLVICNSPVIPFWTQHMFEILKAAGWLVDSEQFVYNTVWPVIDAPDTTVLKQAVYINNVGGLLRANHNRTLVTHQKKSKEPLTLTKLTLRVATDYPEFKQQVISKLQSIVDAHVPSAEDPTASPLGNQTVSIIKEMFAAGDKRKLTLAISFAVGVIAEYNAIGADALQLQMPFDEKEVLLKNAAYIIRTLEPITTADITIEEFVADPNAPPNAPQAVPGKPLISFA